MTGKKPVRPSLPTSREQILVPGLPAAVLAPAPTPEPKDPPPPPPYPGVRGYGQSRPATARTTAKRADPPGMKRESYYVTQAAADAIEAAVEQIRDALGGDVPKQVVLSALLLAGAERASEVAARIAAEQADELSARLAAMRRAAG